MIWQSLWKMMKGLVHTIPRPMIIPSSSIKAFVTSFELGERQHRNVESNASNGQVCIQQFWLIVQWEGCHLKW